MKRRLLISAIAVLILSLAAYGTVAYLNGEATAHNVITAGNVEIELLDQTLSDQEWVSFPEAGLQVMPGTTASKAVSVKNLAKDSWVRVYLNITFNKEDLPPIETESETTSPVKLNLNLGSKTDQWTEGDDGYYYYNSSLQENEITSVLFSEVQFDGRMGNEYQNTELTIQVYAQAVQSVNNPIPSGQNVTQVKGWPAAQDKR